MSLDPQAQKLLDAAKAAGLPPVYTLPVEEARKRMIAAFVTGAEPEPVANVTDSAIPGPCGDIGLRIYTPAGEGPFPILVFFHGGGWTLNNLDTHDGICRSITNGGGCIVVSVDYRLAPEHKFPAAIDDSYMATQWVVNNARAINGDPNRVAVGGDSSGGTQAAAVAMLARDRGGPSLVYQVLIYPVTDYYIPGTPSYEENAKGYSLNRDFMIWFWNNYLPSDPDINNPYICPLRAADLSGLPPAFVLTGEFDPLRDEGEMYAKRLQESGVPVQMKRYEGMMHGYVIQFRVLDKGREALEDINRALRSVFAE
ncbi:MAG: alpha/beta hydrolase [Armatimonadota bacterium]